MKYSRSKDNSKWQDFHTMKKTKNWERFETDCIPQSDTVITSSFRSCYCDLLLSQLSQPNACMLFLLIGFCDFIPHPYGTGKSFCLSNINPLCFNTAMYTMLMKRSKQMMDCSLTAKATSLSLPLKREMGGKRERERVCAMRCKVWRQQEV